MSIVIRRAIESDAELCVRVLAQLPTYFAEPTHPEVRDAIGRVPSWVALDGIELVGFLIAPRRFARGAEITFAAVASKSQGKGIGSKLVQHALAHHQAEEASVVLVKTLDESSGYEPYIATRTFWEGHGFLQVDRIDPLPGWEAGNPSALYVRAIGPAVTSSGETDARRHLLRTFRWTDGHADFAIALRDPDFVAAVGPALAAPFMGSGVTAVVAPEARGFALGALCARELGVGLVLARKPGSVHPGSCVEVVSEPDWRGRKVVFRLSAVLGRTDRVLIVDDWIETGSQASALWRALEAGGSTMVGCSVTVDGTTASVRQRLSVRSIVLAAELPAN